MKTKRATWYSAGTNPKNAVGEIHPVTGTKYPCLWFRSKNRARNWVRLMNRKCKALSIRERQSFFVPRYMACGDLDYERTYRDGSREGYRGATVPGTWTWKVERKYRAEV